MKNVVLARATSVVVTLACLLGMVTSASAGLVAYEGFNYSAGSQINAQSGGTGWGLNSVNADDDGDHRGHESRL